MTDIEKSVFDRMPVDKLPISLHNLMTLQASTIEYTRFKDLDNKIHYVKNLIRKSGYVM